MVINRFSHRKQVGYILDQVSGGGRDGIYLFLLFSNHDTISGFYLFLLIINNNFSS